MLVRDSIIIRSMKAGPILLALLPVMAVLGGAFRWTGGSSEPHPRELRIAIDTYRLPLDFRASFPAESMPQHLIDALWEPLLRASAESSAAHPAAAESWEVLDDGRRLLLHLNPAGRWSNGERVVAADFVRSAHWCLSAGFYHNLLRQLVGVEQYRTGEGPLDRIGMRALDEHRLELEFAMPMVDPASAVADAPFMPLHASTPGALTAAAGRGTPDLVSNGMFALETYSAREVVLQRNPHHRRAALVALDRVRLIPTDGQSVYLALFAADKIDLTQALGSKTELATRRLPAGVELIQEDRPNISALHFNLRSVPLNDVRVRRALSLALDREEVAQRFQGWSARAAWSLTPRIHEDEVVATIREDLAEARRLLAEAGYPEGRGFPVLRVPIVSSSESNPLLYFCADQWRKKLGIRVYVAPLPLAEVETRVMAGEFDMIHFRWTLTPTLVSAVSALGLAQFPPGFFDWDNTTVNQMVSEAWLHQGPARRRKMLEAEQALLEQMPLTPLVTYRMFYLKRSRVGGWSRDVYGRHPFGEFSIAADKEGPGT